MKRSALITLTVLLMTLMICFLSHANDSAINGCYKKIGGQLRIVNDVNECLPSEVPISLNPISSRMPSSTGIKVYDADDQFLGILLDEEGSPYYRMKVFVPLLSRVVLIGYGDGEIPFNHIYFPTDDCSGIPYGNPAMRYQVFQTDNGRYFTSEDSQVERISVGSWLNYGVTCWKFPVDMTVIRLREVTLPFSLPITHPLRFEY